MGCNCGGRSSNGGGRVRWVVTTTGGRETTYRTEYEARAALTRLNASGQQAALQTKPA